MRVSVSACVDVGDSVGRRRLSWSVSDEDLLQQQRRRRSSSGSEDEEGKDGDSRGRDEGGDDLT